MTPSLGPPGAGREVGMISLIKMKQILKESGGRHLPYGEWDHT